MGKKGYLITQFSDLHLTRKNTDSRSEPKLFGRLKGMNIAFERLASSQEAQQSDFVLFTGDTTDTGHPDEWRFFWKILDKCKLNEKSVIIPGNHDMCCLGARLPKSNKKRVSEDLKKFHDGLKLGNYPVPKYPCGIPLNDRIVLFAADTCNKGNTTGITNAMGKLGYQQLERFARELYKFKDVKVKIVILHHSPNIPRNKIAQKRGIDEMTDFERWGMEMPEEDRRSFRLLCVAHRVRLVLHGHLHRSENRYVNSVRYIGAPASTQPRKGRYEFYTYEISYAGGRVVPKLSSLKK
jgi:3',5'-cyclic-AMP phosphodiesterase